MIAVGLTGNMGSGKSTVARIFLSLGVPVFNADIEARNVTADKRIVDQIFEIFGFSVQSPSGELDRKALASIVFADKSKLSQLNNLVHPLIWKRYQEWLNTQSSKKYIIHEAAILFESGLYKNVDKIIVVEAPRDIIISRTMLRDHISEDQVMARLNNQWPVEKMKQWADFVIINDYKQALLPQVLGIDQQLGNR